MSRNLERPSYSNESGSLKQVFEKPSNTANDLNVLIWENNAPKWVDLGIQKTEVNYTPVFMNGGLGRDIGSIPYSYFYSSSGHGGWVMSQPILNNSKYVISFTAQYQMAICYGLESTSYVLEEGSTNNIIDRLSVLTPQRVYGAGNTQVKSTYINLGWLCFQNVDYGAWNVNLKPADVYSADFISANLILQGGYYFYVVPQGLTFQFAYTTQSRANQAHQSFLNLIEEGKNFFSLITVGNGVSYNYSMSATS